MLPPESKTLDDKIKLCKGATTTAAGRRLNEQQSHCRTLLHFQYEIYNKNVFVGHQFSQRIKSCI